MSRGAVPRTEAGRDLLRTADQFGAHGTLGGYVALSRWIVAIEAETAPPALDVERLMRVYEDHPQPSESTEYVAHERGRCKMVCWRWMEREYARLTAENPA